MGSHDTKNDWTDKLEDKTDELADKLHNKQDKLEGKAKEAEGNLTDDDSRKNEGRWDQAKSDLKDAGEKVKDAFKH